jgi:hypothetical protein
MNESLPVSTTIRIDASGAVRAVFVPEEAAARAMEHGL